MNSSYLKYLGIIYYLAFLCSFSSPLWAVTVAQKTELAKAYEAFTNREINLDATWRIASDGGLNLASVESFNIVLKAFDNLNKIQAGFYPQAEFNKFMKSLKDKFLNDLVKDDVVVHLDEFFKKAGVSRVTSQQHNENWQFKVFFQEAQEPPKAASPTATVSDADKTFAMRSSDDEQKKARAELDSLLNATPTSDQNEATKEGFRWAIGGRTIISAIATIKKMYDDLNFFPSEEERKLLFIVYSAGKKIENSPDTALDSGSNLKENANVSWDKAKSQFLGYSGPLGNISLDWSDVKGAVADITGLNCPDLPIKDMFTPNKNITGTLEINGVSWNIWDIMRGFVFGGQRFGFNIYVSGGLPNEKKAVITKTERYNNTPIVSAICKYPLEYRISSGELVKAVAEVRAPLYKKLE